MRLRRKIIAVISNLLLIAGLLLPAVGAYAEQPVQSNSESGTWSVTAAGPTYDTTNNTTTWTYTINKTSTGPDLSHFNLGTCQGLTVVSATPNYTEIGKDGSIGLNDIIKWDSPNLTSVSVTYQGLLAPGDQTWWVKAGSSYASSTVQAASCTPVNGSFTVSKKVSTQANDANPVGSIELVGGGTAHYYYTVTNTGNVPLTLTADDDKIDAEITFSPNPVPAGQTSTATATKTFAALTAGADPVTETNTITVTGTYQGLSFGPNQATAQVINKPAAEPDPAFTIAKTVSKTNTSATGTESISFDEGAGGTAYFFYTITNIGNVPLDLESGADNKIPTALTWSGTTIPVGQSVTATASKSFAQPAPGSAPTTETNTLSVTVSYDGTDLPEQTDTASVTLVAAPNRLKLTSMCSANPAATRNWRVRNTNNVAVTYVWQLVGTEQTGTRTVAANSDDFFETTTVGGANTLKILVAGSQQDVKASGGAQCAPDFTVNKTVSTTDDPTTGQPSLTLDGVGGTVYYFYTITNTGQFALDVTQASDNILGNIAMSQTTIPAGGIATGKASKTFPQLAPGSGQITTETNVFSATATYNQTVIGPKTEDATVTVTAAPNKLKLTSMCSNVPTETRAWRVRNTNSVPVTYVWQLVGTEQTGTRTVAANSDDFFETTTVGGSNTLKILVNGSQQDVKASGGAACQSASFEVTKKVNSENNKETATDSITINGGTAYYFYTITNTGQVDLTLVSAVDDILGDIVFETTTISPGGSISATADKLFNELHPWDEGEEETNTIEVTVSANGTNLPPQTAQATVYNNPPDATPDFTLTKHVSANDTNGGLTSLSLTRGGRAYYFYTITNTGNVPLSLEEAIDDKLGDIPFFVIVPSFVGEEGPGYLMPGESWDAMLTKDFAALPTGQSETEKNIATVTMFYPYEERSITKTAEATVTNSTPSDPIILTPGFSVSKTVSTTNNATTGAGSVTLNGNGTAYYFYTITNTGQTTLNLVSAMDDKLGALNFTPTTIPVGGSATATANKTFSAPPAGGTPLTEVNTVTVTVSSGGTNLPPSVASASVTVNPPPANPDFTVVKRVSTTNDPTTGQASLTVEGDTLVYYFYTLTNTGNVPLNLLDAVDDKIGDLSFSPTVVPVGGTARATASKIIATNVTETNVVTVRTTYGTTVVGPKNDRVTVVNTGQPVGSVEVRVLDGSPRNNGQLIPIPGALVNFTGGRTGRTNENGSIVFTNLPFGGYSADASSEDPQNPTPASIKSGNGSTAIDINNRDEVINIILNWDAPLAGALGQPVATPGTTSLVVTVCYPFTTVGGEIIAEGPGGAVLNLTGKPAADGTYRFDGLTAGQWKISMKATGLSTVVTETVNVTTDNTYTLDMSAACPAGNIAGRICSPSAPGAELTAVGPDGKTAATRVAANGILGQWRDYVLNNLIPGTWTLSLKLPNNDPVSQTLEVKAGETTMAKDFTLACTGSPGPATSPLYLYGGLMFLAGVALKLRLRRKGAAA